ncbi:MAG: SDR family oxidoreductase [Proteobacteria bacterium]|nr:SDR family oxidoreductase [Pseudomonadota bacterium]MBU4258131.1 SDR family oxidoreductase [Pseudomonadota bacterium]MBU4286789.1 SDR family oxidoreductase [Pseudomonadota bacterium]MBU4413639.1 SDR family oxidoreductase [Pseudomonadota bacterium]MCG2758611.1 SDR family oxidoreductase [Desulfobacteraceae bacterium]
MKVVIAGVSGLLGSNLVMTMRGKFDTVGTYNQNKIGFDGICMENMDITSGEEVNSTILSAMPDILIHCAAETRVDHCEEYPGDAFRVNVEGTSNLALASAKAGAKMIYISTDSVFDGLKGNYSEKDETNPVNVYAQTKLEGEKAVKKYCDNYLILRTNIYGWNARSKSSLAEWVLNRLKSGDRKIPGFGDVFFSPMLVNDLAHIIEKMIGADLRGLFHVGASDKCSKLDFARMICRVFDENSRRVVPSNSDTINFRARRPKDTSLNVTKVTLELENAMPTVVEGLRHFRELLDSGYVDQLKAIVMNQEVSL